MFQKYECYEYDIRSCNISILRELNIIDDKKYSELYEIGLTDKHKRLVEIGLLIRDNPELDIQERLTRGIEDAVRRFKTLNNLNEKDIAEVNKDAVWVYKQVSETQISEHVLFVCKRSCTSVFKFKKVKFYYNSNTGELFQRGLGTKEFKIYKVIAKAMHFAEFGYKEKLYHHLHKYKMGLLTGSIEPEEQMVKNTDNIEFIDQLIRDLI